MKRYMTILLLASIIVSCSPQATATEISPIQPESTQTSVPPIITVTASQTSAPTETPLPSETASPTPPSCAAPVNPIDNATIPARGPFDFTWTAFAGASSYIISIGPQNWYPTNFPVNGTTLTRFMENFPASPSYEWSITAVDSSGREICKAGPYAFITSVNVSATASFNGGVIVASDSSNSSNTSSNNQQNGSNNGSTDTSNSRGDSSGTSSSDISMMIFADGDDQQCRLSVIYKIKSNTGFSFLRLLYRYNGQEGFVDLTAPIQDPYPAYNFYSASTPPLPVRHGDTVNFGVWYRADTGGETRAVTLLHSMSNCTQ